MKIQQTQANVGFGNQYAVYERTIARGLKPLGLPTKAAKREVRRLIQPIGTIEQGYGLLVFREGRVSEDKRAITLLGSHIKGQRKNGGFWSYEGEEFPVEITLPRDAEPETVRQKVLRFLNERRLIN